MNTTRNALLTTLALTLPLAGAMADTFIFYGGAANNPYNWYNRTNWVIPPNDEMAGRYPVPADTIIIRSMVDIPNWTFPDLRLVSGGAIRGSFTVGGTLLWTGGTLAVGGTVTVPTNAVVNMAFAEAGILSGVLVNQGTMLWPTGSWSAVVFDGGRLDNMPNGLVDMQLDGDFVPGVSSGGVFNNAGTFRKSGSGHTNPGGSDWAVFRPGVMLNNTGTVDLQSGTLRFTDGFSSSSRFTVATNAVLQLTGGTFHLLPGHLFDGPGSYGVFLGPVVIDGPITEPNFLLASGSLTISNQITGTVCWGGYATLGGAPTIASNGVIKVTNPAGAGFANMLSGVLTNYGTFLWPSNTYPAIVFYNGRLENRPGALVDMQLGGSFHVAGAGGQFNNAGVIRVSAGSDTAAFNTGFGFNNTSVVDLQSGTLQFTDGFTSSGTFLVGTNTSVRLNGGTFHFLPGHAFVGSGNYGVDANVVLDGPITDPNFQLRSGRLLMTNQITGTLVWRSGQLGGAPTIASGGVLRYVAGATETLTGVLTNHGLFVWAAGSVAGFNFNDGRFENMPDGLVDMQLDGGFYRGGGSAQFNNAGVLRKSAGNGTSHFIGGVGFQNSGLLDVQSGALELPVNSLLPSGRLNCALRSASDFGRIAFNGSAMLAGTLSAELLGGFTPPVGAQFEVITSGGLANGFAAFSLPNHFSAITNASSVVLTVGSGGPVTLRSPELVGTSFTFAFQSEAGQSYTVQRNDDLRTTNWTFVESISGDGGMKSFLAPAAGEPQRFFRVKQP